LTDREEPGGEPPSAAASAQAVDAARAVQLEVDAVRVQLGVDAARVVQLGISYGQELAHMVDYLGVNVTLSGSK
jgi:hypothetical protein